MCDEGKDRFWGGGDALRIFLPENGSAGQISSRNTDLNIDVEALFACSWQTRLETRYKLQTITWGG